MQRLRDVLNSYEVEVWLNRDDIMPGTRWKRAIREAISEGAFFIACFSREYNEREKTYMNEELTIAIEELRQRPRDRAWFIPVKLNQCEIPDWDIGAGETLQDLQYVELDKNWNDGIQDIIDVIQPSRMEMLRLKTEILKVLQKINPRIIKELEKGKKISVVANREDYANLIELNDSCGVLEIEPTNNTIFGFHACYSLGIYTVRDNHAAKVHFYLSFAEEHK